MALTVKVIESAKKGTVHTDGQGLELVDGTRWRYRYMLKGKRRDMAIGLFPTLSLAEARKVHAAARALVKSGIDPLAQREKEKAAAEEEKAAADAERRAALAARIAAAEEAERKAEAARLEAKERAFWPVALLYIADQAPGWKNAKTQKEWRVCLQTYAKPILEKHVAEVSRGDVLAILRPIWNTKQATGRKVHSMVGAVLRYAAAHEWRDGPDPTNPKMLRIAGLPDQRHDKPHPALPWHRAAEFLKALDARRESPSMLALRFIIFSVLRSGEVRKAKWEWLALDGEHPCLVVPPEAMKGNVADPHYVPLSDGALDTLRRAHKLAGGDGTLTDLDKLRGRYIFPGTKGQQLSDMAISMIVRKMNKPNAIWVDDRSQKIVPHGWRSTFRVFAAEKIEGSGEAAEICLGHVVGTKVTRAYQRSSLIRERARLMQRWADLVLGRAGEVVAFPGRAGAA